MAWKIDVYLTDGGCPPNTRYEAVTEIEESSDRVACSVQAVGRRTKFMTPDPTIGYLSWRVEVNNGANMGAFIGFVYNFPKLKTHKSISEELAPRYMPPAQLTLPDPEPIPPDPMDPPPPLPPPTGTRLIATYSEEGTPKADVGWTAGTESGVTNSFGEVRINDLGPVTLTMLNFTVGDLIEDETVEINATGLYL